MVGLLPFLPESPRWLAYHDRTEDCLRVLAKINGADEQDAEVQLQYMEVINTLEHEKTNGNLNIFAMLKEKGNRRRLILALSVAPLAMLTGSNIIT